MNLCSWCGIEFEEGDCYVQSGNEKYHSFIPEVRNALKKFSTFNDCASKKLDRKTGNYELRIFCNGNPTRVQDYADAELEITFVPPFSRFHRIKI